MNKKGFAPIYIVLGVLIIVIVTGGAYYLGSVRKQTSQPKQVNNPTPNQQSSPNLVREQISPTMESDSMNGWISKKSAYCNVTFTYPTDKTPYFEYIGGDNSNPQNKRFWQLREAAGASDGHKIFKSSSTLLYVADIEASGFIAGMVGVQCAPNAGYILDSAPDIYAAGFGTDIGIKVKSKRTTKIWGKDVIAAKFEGGMFSDNEIYFVVTDKNIYKMDKRSDSDKEFVRTTTDQIFNNLKFSE